MATIIDTAASSAYNATVLGQGVSGTAEFDLAAAARSNPALADEIRAEIAQLDRIRKRCFVSGQRHAFLNRVIARLSDGP